MVCKQTKPPNLTERSWAAWNAEDMQTALSETDTINDTKMKQTKNQPNKKPQTFTCTKPTNKPHQPASGICSFLGSERKHTNSNTIKGDQKNCVSKGIHVWFEDESTGEKEIMSSQTITMHCKTEHLACLSYRLRPRMLMHYWIS